MPLTTVAWQDDSQIVHEVLTKVYAGDGEPIGVAVVIAPVDGTPPVAAARAVRDDRACPPPPW
jgi:hypothetical protein